MNKEDKYSLGYAIGQSIEENKVKIAKLEKQNKRLKKKLEERDKVIDELKIALINYKFEWEDDDEVIDDINKFLEIIERGKNGK